MATRPGCAIIQQGLRKRAGVATFTPAPAPAPERLAAMKVAALQMNSGADVAANLRCAQSLVAQAAAQGCELVVLPEYFCLMGQRDRDKLAIAEPHIAKPNIAEPNATNTCASGAEGSPPLAGHDGGPKGLTPIQDSLAAMAREHGIWLVAGTLPLQSDDPQRVRNSTLVFGPQGHCVARYDKMHLFCYDDGVRRYDEAQTLEAGQAPVALTVTDRAGLSWRVGLGVCYDLRFPELFRHLGQAQALDILVLPAAFTDTTGRAHWEVLLRARAIENLCHVIASAQADLHDNGRRTFGHSMVINPWGEVLAQLDSGIGVVSADLDAHAQARWRQQLPALQHRRL